MAKLGLLIVVLAASFVAAQAAPQLLFNIPCIGLRALMGLCVPATAAPATTKGPAATTAAPTTAATTAAPCGPVLQWTTIGGAAFSVLGSLFGRPTPPPLYNSALGAALSAIFPQGAATTAAAAATTAAATTAAATTAAATTAAATTAAATTAAATAAPAAASVQYVPLGQALGLWG